MNTLLNDFYEVAFDSIVANSYLDSIEQKSIVRLAKIDEKFTGLANALGVNEETILYHGCMVKTVIVGSNSFDMVSRYDITNNQLLVRVLAY